DYGAMVSGIYGDSKAIPHLQQALDDWELEDVTDSLLANQEVIELCSAIKELGGILTLEEEKKLKDVLALREKYSEQIDLMLRMDGDDYGEEKEPIRNLKPKLGRNDPCWCGSGKKYKKCHWLSDQTSYN
ncbi:MAG: SEC-C metal-binding domain-containing protein, partial [Candidatus Latescibacteria bacterium]|nr:SEC-C metal-binding domain-containing protein [Candidatus Latescibacterota bacterium]